MAATTDIENRIEDLVTKIWGENQCSHGGVVDREFFKRFTADIYEKAMLDAMVILEGTEGQKTLESTTGYSLAGR